MELFRRMPFPRPDNMVEIVAECWMSIDDAVSRTSAVGARTVGGLLSSLSDFIYARGRPPRYLDIFNVILEYRRTRLIRTTAGIVGSQIEW